MKTLKGLMITRLLVKLFEAGLIDVFAFDRLVLLNDKKGSADVVSTLKDEYYIMIYRELKDLCYLYCVDYDPDAIDSPSSPPEPSPINSVW